MSKILLTLGLTLGVVAYFYQDTIPYIEYLYTVVPLLVIVVIILLIKIRSVKKEIAIVRAYDEVLEDIIKDKNRQNQKLIEDNHITNETIESQVIELDRLHKLNNLIYINDTVKNIKTNRTGKVMSILYSEETKEIYYQLSKGGKKYKANEIRKV